MGTPPFSLPSFAPFGPAIRTPWLAALVAFPLFGAFLAATLSWVHAWRSRHAPRTGAPDEWLLHAVAGIVPGAGAFGGLLAIVDAWTSREGTTLIAEAGRTAATGSLELGFGLAAGAGTALAVVFVFLLGGWAIAQAAARPMPDRVRPRLVAASLTLLAGIVALVLADDVLTASVAMTFAGLGLAALPPAGLPPRGPAAGRPASPRGSGRGGRGASLASTASAVAAALVASAILFYSLAGSWEDGEFTPDLGPRALAVGSDGRTRDASSQATFSAEKRAAAEHVGCLTIDAWRGAEVFLGEEEEDGSLHLATIRAPFRCVPIPRGRVAVRIEPRGGTQEISLDGVSVPSDEEVVIVPVGPAVSLHRIGDQLLLRGGDDRFLHDAWVAKAGPLHLPLRLWVYVSWALALGLFAAAGRRRRALLDPGPLDALGDGLFPFAACAFGARLALAIAPGAPIVARLLALGCAGLAGRAAWLVSKSDPIGRRFRKRLPPEAAAAALPAHPSPTERAIALAAGIALDLEDLVAVTIFRRVGRALRSFSRWLGDARRASAIVLVLATAAMVSAPGIARAERLEAGEASLGVRSEDGTRGPVVLSPGPSGFDGTFELTNESSEPVEIARLSPRLGPRTSEPESSPELRAALETPDGIGERKAMTLAPRERARVRVTWAPSAASPKQLVAHIVVTLGGERPGEVAIGVRAGGSSALGLVHPVSVAILLPFLAGLALLALGGRIAPRAERAIAYGVAGTALAQILRIYGAYDRSVHPVAGTIDFVDRTPWLRTVGIEWFVGVDATNLGALLAIGFVSFAAIVAAGELPGAGKRRGRALVGMGILLLVVASFDAFFVAAGLLAFAFLFVAEDDRRTRGLGFAVAAILLFLGVSTVRAFAAPGYLVDGTITLHPFAIPELARTDYAHAAGTVLGLPPAGVSFGLFASAVVFLLAGVPLHRPMFALYTRSRLGPLEVIACAAMVPVGAAIAFKLLVGLLPETARTAGGVMGALGGLTIAYAALLAFGQRTLSGLAAYVTISGGGSVLLGLATLTPEGLTGALLGSVASAISACLLATSIGALEARVPGGRVGTLEEVGGLAAEMPGWAGFVALAAASMAGVPGTAGFFGRWLPVWGAFPLHTGSAIVSALGALVVGRALLGGLRAVFFGRFPPAWRSSPALGKWHGRLPDLSAREVAAVAPLAVLLLVLGLWPGPFLNTLSSGLRDVLDLVNPPGADQIG